jgi:class 3 adenylate cyclase
MVRLARRFLGLGVVEGSSEEEARRVRTINAIALIATIATVLTTTFYIVAVDSSQALMVIGLSTLFIVGYAATAVVNALGHVEAAVWAVLSTGVIQIVLTTITAGFDQGPAPFFLVIALGGVLTTRIHDRISRWFFIGVSAVGYAVLAVINPEGPPSTAGSDTETFSSVRQFLLMILFAAGVARYQRLLAHRAEEALAEANTRSETLLLNILPEEIADRLRSGETEIADRVDEVTVMFIDLVGSTRMSERLSASELVSVLNDVFTGFDALADEHELEKIKTIGDAYMVVGGLPGPRPDHAAAIADMALAARDMVAPYSVPGFGPLELRIGIDTGPVVAGVIGRRKFSYDLWGSTVNTASRMQSNGIIGEIQVTESVFDVLRHAYLFEGPRPISVKGIEGELSTYLLKAAYQATEPRHPEEGVQARP